MEFLLNIKGQLNNIHLAEAKALWPLFEAVVNSLFRRLKTRRIRLVVKLRFMLIEKKQVKFDLMKTRRKRKRL